MVLLRQGETAFPPPTGAHYHMEHQPQLGQASIWGRRAGCASPGATEVHLTSTKTKELQTETEKDRQRETEIERQTKREREIHRERGEGEREREKKKRERHTERVIQREIERETEAFQQAVRWIHISGLQDLKF
uniref:Uncharacterized protein n=1 Tax=Laticauda laticaudata TaxID=8630 RepID=A0A8C5S9X5_LATLA